VKFSSAQSVGSTLSALTKTLLGGGIVIAAVVLAAGPASAHNSPVGYSPAENSVVTQQPGVFSVTTSDELLDLDGSGSASAMNVSGPTGGATPLYYGDGCATVSGATLETAAQLGAAGEYTVIWQTVSTDGHPISGEFAFTWQPADGEVLAAGSTVTPDCGGAAEQVTGAPGVGTAESTTASSGSGAAWIGGVLGAILLAVGVTFFVLRRKPKQ